MPTPTPTTPHTGGRPQRSHRDRSRALAVVGAAAAALAVWAIAVPVAGVDLDVRMGDAEAETQRVGPGAVAVMSLLVGLAAWGLLALLERFTPRARALWTVAAVTVLIVSLAGPLGGGVNTGAKAVLVALHIAAAAVLIPVLAKSSGRP